MHLMTKPVYFPGLNALRAYAALSVVVYHIGNSAVGVYRSQPDTLGWLQSFFLHGYEAVTLFFVLSGFLITYLLFREREHAGTISVQRFYMRRALRIYPLYYAVVFVGFVVIPALFGSGYGAVYSPISSLPLVVIMLPNLTTLGGLVAHLWSIGVEEQFYLVLPLIFRIRHLLVPAAIAVIVVKLLIGLWDTFAPSPELHGIVLWFRFECMAVGVLGAWLYVQREDALRIFYHKLVQALAWFAFALFVFVDPPVNAVWNLLTSVVFLVIILNVATNEHTVLKLEHRAFRWLGDRSYGIYMLHYPVLFLVYVFAAPIITGYTEVVLLATLTLTLLGAHLSRQFLEAPFLRLKERAHPLANTAPPVLDAHSLTSSTTL